MNDEAAVARIRAEVTRLYGDVALEHDEGVVHVAAVFADGDAWRVLRIGDEAPRSATDAFVLALSRARADAIIVTGKILRDEPDLRYALEGDTGSDLLAWRGHALGRSGPPALLVLTRSGAVAPEHPALHGWATPIVVTGPEGSSPAAGLGARTVVLPEPSLRAAITWAHAELGARTISIEAGPSTARELYEEPAIVDELMLSIYEGPGPSPAARGGRLVAQAQAQRVLGESQSEVRVAEPSGSWRFVRLRNKPGPAGVRS